jgi:hypothetical protein
VKGRAKTKKNDIYTMSILEVKKQDKLQIGIENFKTVPLGITVFIYNVKKLVLYCEEEY